MTTALQPWCEPVESRQFHLTASYVRDEMGPPWSDYFSFAVVRNPWDWVVSLYHWLIANPDHDLAPFVRSMTFREFVAWLDDPAGPSRQPPARHGSWSAYRQPQTTWIVDRDGRQIVSYIARFETLADEWIRITERIGLPGLILPHTNTSKHPPYRECYDRSTREAVARIFTTDVARFGYEF